MADLRVTRADVGEIEFHGEVRPGWQLDLAKGGLATMEARFFRSRRKAVRSPGACDRTAQSRAQTPALKGSPSIISNVHKYIGRF